MVIWCVSEQFCGFGFGVVLYGDFFAVAFVDVHVRSKILNKVPVGGCGDYGFAVFARLFL